MRFCAQAATGDPVWLRHIRDVSARGPRPLAPLPPAESIRLVRAMRACPHFRARSDCGCSVNACAHPWRTRLVAHRDCAACLARTVE